MDLDSLSKSELVSRVHWLEEQLDAKKTVDEVMAVQVKYGCTASEARLLIALPEGRPVTVGALIALLWQESPDSNVLRVMVSKLRKKVEPHGMKILNVYGSGYMRVAA